MTPFSNKFIFKNQASICFHEKLSCFLDFFLDKLILNGVSKNNTPISIINFTESKSYITSFYDTLLTLFEYSQPSSIVRLINNNRMESECLFYDYTEVEYFKSIFMVYNIMDWTDNDNFNCQVWTTRDVDLETINYYWTV
jgi:hypothetical protein